MTMTTGKSIRKPKILSKYAPVGEGEKNSNGKGEDVANNTNEDRKAEEQDKSK